MRNKLQFAVSLVLLASQVHIPGLGGVSTAAAASSGNAAVASYEVTLDPSHGLGISMASPVQPNYTTQVLEPIQSAQAAAAKAAAAAAAAAREAAAQAKEAAEAAAAALPVGSHDDWMRKAGIAPSDFGYANFIISHESGWGVTKYSYDGSGAYGLGQASPAAKMAVFGSDYMSNPITQLKWANAYAVSRYGSWAGAYQSWTKNHRW